MQTEGVGQVGATRVRTLTIELVQGGHARETLTVRQLRPVPSGPLEAVLDGVHRLARPEAGQQQHDLVTADAGQHVAEPVADLA